MKTLKKYWWLFLTFIIVTLVFIVGYKGNITPIEWETEDNLKLLGAVFAKLLIVGALLDQLIAVFFPQDESDAEQRAQAKAVLFSIREKEKFLNKEMLAIELSITHNENTINSIQSLSTQITTLANSKQTAENKIMAIDAKRSHEVRMVAFAGALIIAVSGITILSDFVDLSREVLNVQILSYIDVIFTAAVLSGGTTGINQLLKMIKDSWNKS